jgi:hypothetical protein
MGLNYEWNWEVARYRNMLPDPRAQIYYDALRRAHELRHEAIRENFAALANGLRGLGGFLVRLAWR